MSELDPAQQIPESTQQRPIEGEKHNLVENLHSIGGSAAEFLRSGVETFGTKLPAYAAAGVLAMGGAYELAGVASAESQPQTAAATRDDNAATPWKQCLRRYNKHDETSWICAKVVGPRVIAASTNEKVTYKYDFKARHALRGLKLCFGGGFEEANKDGCLWHHKYTKFRKGREVKKTLSGTPEFQNWGGANVVIFAASRKPANAWRAIGTLRQEETPHH